MVKGNQEKQLNPDPLFAVFNITPEFLHTLGEDTNRILNQLGSPSIRSHIGDIFADTGLIYEGYIFKAQAVGSAFTITITYKRKKGKDFLISYSVTELLDQAWKTNTRLPNPIIEALNIVYELLVFPHIDDFKRVLSGKRTVTPIGFMQFTRGQIVEAKPVFMVYCNINKRNMSRLFCVEVCPNFDHIDDKDRVFCKKITQIE